MSIRRLLWRSIHGVHLSGFRRIGSMDRRIAWFPVGIFALVIAMFLDLSLSLAKDVEVADESGANVGCSADHLAGREMDIGRYLLAKHDYTAAINRFKTVVTQYPASPQIEETLAYLAEMYLALHIASEAQTAVAVLDRKLPTSHSSIEAHDASARAGLDPVENENSRISKALK
jgi:Outer membrane lipoprotein